MIGFFYETFLQTGWILLPLFGLGFWGWWELFRFFFLIYENSRVRRLEWKRGKYSDLEQVLADFTKKYGKEKPAIRFIQSTLDDLLVNQLRVEEAGKKHSYEKRFFTMLETLTKNPNISTSDKEALAHYRDRILQVKRSFDLQVVVDFSKRLKILKLIATIAPLLGLLGTVIGMIDTFDVISSFGNSNPLLLADGISKALLTTQAGLAVAFPFLFLYVAANRRLERLRWRLQAILTHFMDHIEKVSQ